MNIKCLIGLHVWEQSRELAPIDTFPPFFIPYQNPTRKCQRCGKEQYWLPGYGGSEFGCWQTKRQEVKDAEGS